MNFDWLKSISAQIGIEGRNTIILLSLLFCGFGLWIFARLVDMHPALASVFLGLFFLLAAGSILIGLLVQPQPSEVSEKYLLQQIDKQILIAGGFQTSEDLIEFLRQAHEIHYLPAPSGIVEGSATNTADHKPITEGEAERIAESDKANVNRLLGEEAARIVDSLKTKQHGNILASQEQPETQQPLFPPKRLDEEM